MSIAASDATACDVFLTVGTSAVVYPAAGFVRHAKFTGRVHRRNQPRAKPRVLSRRSVDSRRCRRRPAAARSAPIILICITRRFPETFEGWSLLHLMYRVRWDRVRAMAAADRRRMADEAVGALAVPDAGSTAFVQVLGHKADLMVICFRTRIRAAGRRAAAPYRARRFTTCSSRPPHTSRSSSSDVRNDLQDARAGWRGTQAGDRGIRPGV